MKFNEDFEKKAELLKVLAHPVRLCIVKGLMEKSCNVSNMQECLELPQSTVSQHLKVLGSGGVIKGTRNGLEINYSISNDSVQELVKVLFKENDEIDNLDNREDNDEKKNNEDNSK